MRTKHTPLAALGLIAAGFLAAPTLSQAKVRSYIDSLPRQSLSSVEKLDLDLLRQEEKLARDVYRVLYDIWKEPVFANVAQSEQSHMDLVKYVMDRYQLPDPLPSDKLGVFRDANFTHLFHVMVVFGAQSKAHAEVVGAFIEDLDIVDLGNALGRSDNRDLDVVYQNLRLGSRNHMRSFYALLAKQQLYYPGIVLTPAQLSAIVTSPRERGSVDENGLPL